MNKRIASLMMVVLAFVLMAEFSPAQAAAPRKINYQGYLTNPAGAPLTGTYSMVFSLCDAATAGACPWTESQSVAIDKGIFNVSLGAVTPLLLAFDIPYFLDIRVNGEQMSARQPLTTVGYAFSADRAESVAAGSITNASISGTASIDAAKISGLGALATKDAVTSADITNNTITNSDLAAGSFSNITGLGTLDTLTVAGNTNLATTSGAVGVKTTSPRASLEVGGYEGLLVTGQETVGTARALGAGARLHWYPKKGAFRVGVAETTWWDDDGAQYPNLARYSIAMGYQPRATGVASTAIGAFTKATGDYSLALGSYNTASGDYSVAIGGGSSFVTTTASGNNSIAIGTGVDTNGRYGAMVFGDYTENPNQITYALYNNSITMRFTGYDFTMGPYAYKFMTGRDDGTSPYVYMRTDDSAWRSSCSRDLKENFTPVDGEWLLGRIRDLPITQWNYKTADPSVKYVGPVAEDFWDAFKLGGTDNKGISSIAIEGVNIAGVQALEKRTSEMKSEIELLKAEIAALKAQLAGNPSPSP